jgi:Dolichyl-phosphate-mannose-protein mannosyltransferase
LNIRKLLDPAIVSLAAVLLLIAALGGIDYDLGLFRVRLHDWVRPLGLLVIAIGVRGALGVRDAPGRPTVISERLGPFARCVSTRGLVALLLAIAAIYATYQVRVCGGLDSYGYVSTASLLASGHVTEPQPLAALLPFEGASSAVAPLGYVAGPGGQTQVPRFPLGLPAVMAVFTIFGANGPFFVPLVMAYVTVALAFLLGSEPGVAASGLFAAAIVAVDPLLVDYAIQPMSDVPATCWLLAAVWLHIGASRKTRPLLAGLCAGMAFFTRPALLVAAIALGVVTIDRPVRDTIRYGAALLFFIALQMTVNLVLYGSVRTSGYGPASYMFEISRPRLMANVANFGKWLTYSHTAAIWLLWPVALVVLRRRKWAWQISAVAAAAAAPYLFYLVFDDWDSSRFVLPAILLVLILAARALSSLWIRIKPGTVAAFAPVTLLLIALGCATASHRFLQREDVYRLGDLEAKYPLAGEWIQAHLPERAVVLAGLHSGSIRFYGKRETIRWDQIPPDKLSPTLRNLETAGYVPYLALDTASEPPLFAERFRSDPKVQIEQIGRVRVVNIYRFVSGH